MILMALVVGVLLPSGALDCVTRPAAAPGAAQQTLHEHTHADVEGGVDVDDLVDAEAPCDDGADCTSGACSPTSVVLVAALVEPDRQAAPAGADEAEPLGSNVHSVPAPPPRA